MIVGSLRVETICMFPLSRKLFIDSHFSQWAEDGNFKRGVVEYMLYLGCFILKCTNIYASDL